MRVKIALVLLSIAVAFVSIGSIIGQRLVTADIPYADYLLAATSTRIDYAVPPGVLARISSGDAIATARRFANAPDGVARSSRLGLYSDDTDKDLLAWVVDLDQVQVPALAGPVSRDGRQASPAVFTRMVIFVSATDPETVVGSIAARG